MTSQSEASFRDAMRRLAATVTIISTGNAVHRHGITATAVTSLSMDPPSLLVCVNRAGAFHALLAENERFCVNLLRSDHANLSDAFAGRLTNEERFRHGTWREAEDGLPFLADAQANIFCSKHKAIEHGSHSIFIGIVDSVFTTGTVTPLIYSNGTYGHCSPLETIP